MYLSRFGVKNYKCLADVEVALTPIHVLIGQNDSGKTSLLEAMAAFFASSQLPLPQVFPGPWNGRELVFHGSAGSAVELLGEWRAVEGLRASSVSQQLRYGFAVEFPTQGQVCPTPGDWFAIEGERRPLQSPGYQETAIRRWKSGQIRRENLPDLPQIDELSRLLRPVHKYSLEPKLMAIPAAIDPRRKFRLDPDGFGHPTLLDDILGYDPHRFLKLREVFCDAFPQFRSVRIEAENALNRQYVSTGIHNSGGGVGKGIFFEARSGQTVRAQQASDGAILFLGFLALAYLPDPPPLLLIEEPENGIYPKRLEKVVRLLKEIANGGAGVDFPQIVLTTHSPFVLSFFEPEEVTILSRDSNTPEAGVRARSLRDAPHIRERLGNGEFYLGELWYNLSEEELFNEPAGQRGD